MATFNSVGNTIPNLYSNGSGQSYNSPAEASIAAKNLSVAAPNAVPNSVNQTSLFNPNGNTGSVVSPYVNNSRQPQNQYSVITSKPATTNLNNIQTDYNTNIKPAVTAQTQNNAANTAASNQVPTTAGYYPYTTNKTGQAGEISTQINGQTYYATPEKPPVTAEDIKGLVSQPTAPITTTPTTQTPSEVATTQTGVNPTAENATYQTNIQKETDAITTTATSFQNIIQNMSAGSIPFSPAQQSLIDATNSAFQAMTSQAELKAAALSSETGGVSNKVNAMGGQLIQIATEQAAAIAKLEVGFQTENFDEKYKTITEAYAAFKDAETAKITALTAIHNSVMTTYQNAVQAAQAQQTFNQTVIHDKEQLAQSQFEFRDLKDAFGQTIGTQVFDKKTGHVVSTTGNGAQSSSSVVPKVTAGANGQPDPISQANFLSTLPQPYQALVQGIANGKIEPPSARTAKGAQILAWVAQYDPTLSDGSGGFDATKYQARLTMQKSLASYTSGSYGSALMSANKVVSHLESFVNSSNLIPGKTGVDIFGSSKLSANITSGLGALVGVKGGQTAEAQAEQESRGLTDEMTKFFKGTGGTDVKSIESWSRGLDPYAPSGTLKGNVQGTLDLFSGQLNAFIQQYTTVMGKPPDIGTIIQPQTLQKLSAFKNAGFNVDIPGVYYTDKNAYLANGGSQDALNTAYNSLKAAGIPTTPENILQAAQI